MTERATSSIGSTLRDGRLQRGLTEGQLGARVGQTAETISRYESGRSVPDSETMAALNAELKLSSAVTDVNYVPKHSADPAPITPATLDAEPAWETLTVDGAVPALPPVVAPLDESEEQETMAPVSPDPGTHDGSPRSWSGARPWADPTRVVAEVPPEESILPLDELPLPSALRAVDGLRAAPDGELVSSSSVTAIALSSLPEDETRRSPAVDATILTPRTVPDRPRSYLDLPGERSRYRVRAIVTLVGLIALIYVISWAIGRAGDLFDAIFDTVRAIT